MSIKELIAHCLERMRARECATCDNRQACPAGRWQQAFAVPKEQRARAERGNPGPLMALLGQIAASFDGPKSRLRNSVRVELEAMLASGEVRYRPRRGAARHQPPDALPPCRARRRLARGRAEAARAAPQMRRPW